MTSGDKAKVQSWKKLLGHAQAVKGNQIFAEDVQDSELCDRRDAIYMLRQWESYGWGHVIVGRRGASTRFRPGKVVLSELRRCSSADALSAEGNNRASETAQPFADAQNHTAFISHKFHLREELIVTIDLPTDLSDREAKRLARFIESLPM